MRASGFGEWMRIELIQAPRFDEFGYWGLIEKKSNNKVKRI